MDQEILKIIEYVGGEENIVSVTHCITRLRFVLKDDNIGAANDDKICALKMVKGSFLQGGQFQIIIGPEVTNVFNRMLEITNLNGASKQDVKQEVKRKMNPAQKAISFLAEIFIPIIPAIIVGGLILGFRNILSMPMPNLLDGQAIIDVNQFWAGMNDFLWLIGEAIFTFLPVHVVWSTYRKMGGTEILGIVLGITLVSPQLVNANQLGNMISSGQPIPVWDFGAFTIEKIGYQGQVIPALMVGLFGGWLETRITKFVHPSIQLIVVPFVVLVGTSLLANLVIGPIGWAIGSFVSSSVIWLFDTLGVIGGFIFGFLYSPLVITGMHQLIIPINLQLINDIGGTFIFPIVACSNIAQGAAVLATAIVNKRAEDREVSIPSLISAWLGVTEPAMYGVNIKLQSPFVAGMIGAGFAGMYCIATEVMANSIGIGGLPAILSMQPDSMLNWLVAAMIAIVVPVVLTLFFMKKQILEPKK